MFATCHGECLASYYHVIVGDNVNRDAAGFEVQADAEARAWMESHQATEPRVIDYDVHRCCGGGKICQVHVRSRSRSDNSDQYVTGAMADGTRFLIDRRAAARLPLRFRLTVRGLGAFKHLDLDLEAEQWGELLYT